MFQGSMVALVTPMKSGVSPDTALDIEALAKLIEFHIENRTDALVAVGTTGESATLPEKEHCDLIRQFVEIVDGRVPVIAGTGANSTIEAISLTNCARQVGADACLLVTPYYNKPTQEGLFQQLLLLQMCISGEMTSLNILSVRMEVPGVKCFVEQVLRFLQHNMIIFFIGKLSLLETEEKQLTLQI